MKKWFTPTIWLLVLVVVFAQSGTPAYIVHAQETQAELEAKIAQLEKLFEALEAAAKDIPRDTFDLEAALALTDLTPESILMWVRDNTYLVPYKGALRGSQGVLMDRVGNSLDRAMLLQGLMQLLGYDTQLARAQLNEAQAQDILAKTKAIPAEGALPQTADADINTELQKYVGEFGLDGTQITQALEKAQQQRKTLQAQMKERVASQTEFLMNALGNPTGDVAAEKAKQVAALQDHWWVQYQEGGVWVDLDPTMPDAVPNQKIVAANETLVANKLEELPQDLLHILQIKVVLECALESGLQETTLVESPVLIPANLLGQRIAISHVPVNMPVNLRSKDVNELRDLILKQDHWFPVLTIGTEQVFTYDYTSACEIGTASPPWLGTAIAGGLGNVIDALGGVDGGGVVAESNEHVTAQWIEYTLHQPGEPDNTVQRQIFDLLGSAARTDGVTEFSVSGEKKLAWRSALLGETEILPLAFQVSPDYFTFLAVKNLLSNREPLFGLLGSGNDQSKIDEANSKLELLPSQLYSLALIRREWSTVNSYLDRPNILSYHKQQKFTAQNDVAAFEGFDIVVNSVAIAADANTPFISRLQQGVADTNAEALLAGAMCQDSAEIVCPRVSNSSEMLRASNELGITWHTVRQPSELSDIELSPDTQKRIEQELANGYAVIVPNHPVQMGEDTRVTWWRIDATSGESLGIGETGWGATGPEYVALLKTVLSTAACGFVAGVRGSYGGLAVCVLANGFAGAGWLVGLGGEAKMLKEILALVGEVIKISYAVGGLAVR
jgi:hypothetical protein